MLATQVREVKGEQAKPHQDTEIYEKKYSDVHFSSDATHGHFC
jgi:hypothetical protein